MHNNFDLLRLLLAAAVLLVHAHALSGADQLGVFSRLLNSTYAVWGFFAISGHLIAMSYERSRSLGRFALKRARRLLPAYVVVVLVSAGVGAVLTTLPVSAYLTSPQLRAYLLANLSFLNFLQPALPGVFEANPHGPAVNGSLWSIRSELLCYAAVPVVAWLAGRIGRAGAVAGAAIACASAGGVLLWIGQRTQSPVVALLKLTFADCGLCFALGIASWYFRRRLDDRWFAWLGLGSLALLATGATFDPWVELVGRPVVLTAAVLYVALRLPYLGNWGRFGDLSYGVYVYHFPVIQTLVAAGWFASAPYPALAAAVAITLVLAFASWHLVEAPWLRADSHYIRSSAADTGDDHDGRSRNAGAVVLDSPPVASS